MIVSRTFAALALSIGIAGCADRIERLCQADIRERLINPDTVTFHDFSTLSYDERINELVEASLTAPPAIPGALRAAHRSDLQRRARRMSQAWAKLEMSFHRYNVEARGRSGRDVAATLSCGATPTMCRCDSPLAHRELYRS